jgi:hypothetical protein
MSIVAFFVYTSSRAQMRKACKAAFGKSANVEKEEKIR